MAARVRGRLDPEPACPCTSGRHSFHEDGKATDIQSQASDSTDRELMRDITRLMPDPQSEDELLAPGKAFLNCHLGRQRRSGQPSSRRQGKSGSSHTQLRKYRYIPGKTSMAPCAEAVALRQAARTLSAAAWPCQQFSWSLASLGPAQRNQQHV